MAIQGILFDSGDTLVYPKGGSWWPGYEFDSILQRYGVSIPTDPDTMKKALAKGQVFLNNNHRITDIEEERKQFKEYYLIVCGELGITASQELLDELVYAYVDTCNFSLYPDTIPVLNQLTEDGFTLGIVSDAWPSLHNKYVSLEIRNYFTSFTISSVAGCSKPGQLIYQKAVDEIGIDPDKLLFIDDDIENVKAAMRFGMYGAVIQRNQTIDTGDIPSAYELFDIVTYIEGKNETG